MAFSCNHSSLIQGMLVNNRIVLSAVWHSCLINTSRRKTEKSWKDVRLFKTNFVRIKFWYISFI